MATTLSTPNTATISLDAFGSITISSGATGTIAFTSIDEGIKSSFTEKIQNRTYGPYGVPMTVVITPTSGSLSYTLNNNINANYTFDANGNVIGFDYPSGVIKISPNLVNLTTKYWMPYAGTWATDGTPTATGVVATGHLYAVGDKLVVPPLAGGTTLTTGTVIPAGTYTITSSATPNFSCTLDSNPTGNLTAGTGSFDGTTLQEVYRYTIAGNLMGVNDAIKGSAIGYYGPGSATSKRVRVYAGNGAIQVANVDIVTAGVAMGEFPFGFKNRNSLSSQLYMQTYAAAGPTPTTFGSLGGLASINTSSNHYMHVSLQKTTGSDALALLALEINLQRI